MALKPDRNILEYDITLTLSDVASAGVIVMNKSGSAGSGSAIGDTSGACTLASNPSGLEPAGLLLVDFVDIDTTKYHKNFHNDEQVIDDKAPLMYKGWVVTDKILGTPSVGSVAYVGGSGLIQTYCNGVAQNPPVGKFLSTKDENGYAKVAINLPITHKAV